MSEAVFLKHCCIGLQTCLGLYRDCSEPGLLELWLRERFRTLAERALTQTVVPQTED